MTSSELALLGGVVVLLLATSYLAAAETVVTRCKVVRALRLAEEGRGGSDALLWLAEHRATSLNVLLVATVAARVGGAAAGTVLGLSLAGGAWTLLGVLAVVVVANLLLGEVAPRTLVLRHLERSGLALAGSARLLVRGLEPVGRLVVGLGRGLVPRRHEVSGPYASDDELRALESEEESEDEELEPEERAMIRSIFELGDTVVREVMVPRPDMLVVAESDDLDTVVGLVVERGVSRIPVHSDEEPDRVVGVVHAKDLLPRIAGRDEHARWRDLMREPTFVPETKRCDELLRELQETAVHLAVVVDEYGQVAGLVTIEDLLEEIVGEIVDEHDREEPLVELLDEGHMRIDARLGVDDLNELLQAELPEEGWDTVGGLVFGTLGRVPDVGETIELDGFALTVERVQGRRVGKVLVGPREQDDEEPAELPG